MPTTTPEELTTREAAMLIGTTVNTIYDLVRARTLPHRFDSRGRMRIDGDAFRDLLGAEAPAGWLRTGQAARRLGLTTPQARRVLLRAGVAHVRLSQELRWSERAVEAFVEARPSKG